MSNRSAPLQSIEAATDLARRVADIYAENFGIERSALWYLAKMQEELGELSAATLSASGQGRDRGMSSEELSRAVEDEAADLFAFLLVFAADQGICLESALARKWGKYLHDEDAD